MSQTASNPEWRHWVAALVAFSTFAAAPVLGCSTPVYRYALENWMPMPYEVVVFRRGKSEGESGKKFDEARKMLTDTPANIALMELDAADPIPEEYQAFWEDCKDQSLPWMIVRFPQNVTAQKPVWSAAFNAENVKHLLDSPVRQHLARHLAAGDAAVWIMAESGRKGLDDAKAEIFEKAVKSLTEEFSAAARMATVDNEGGDPAGPPPAPLVTSVTFSFIRVPIKDQTEDVFVRMLAGREAKLADLIDEPRAFLVFGRGRALGPLTGPEIKYENIASATSFLSGPCMCEIKEQNPGMDLLMNIDWSSVLDRTLPVANPAATAPGISTADKLPAIPYAQPVTSPPVTSPPVSSPPMAMPDVVAPSTALDTAANKGLILAIAMIVAGIASILVSLRGRKGA